LNAETAPLRGIRVLDLTHAAAGPFCTKLMADYGAEVIKVERPRGECARRDPGMFAYLNAGKLGVTIELESAEGKQIARQLAAKCDVVVESSRPGRMEELGLRRDELQRDIPHIVGCSISSFGRSGPYRDDAASELVLQSLGGLTYLTGSPDREPLGIPVPLAQLLAGVEAYVATLAACWSARMSGIGDWIDVSIFESLITVHDNVLASYAYSGSVQRRIGPHVYPQYPTQAWRCRDGWVFAFVVSADDWMALTDLMGRPDLRDDPSLRSPAGRKARAAELDAALAEWIGQRDAADVYHAAQARRVPFAIVATADHLLASAHLRERDALRTLRVARQTVKAPGIPFQMDGWRPDSIAPPSAGEHSRQVLEGILGMSNADVERLHVAGVV